MFDRRSTLTVRDYLALGISLVLAFVVWLVHNLSLNYSALVQRTVVAVCEIDGHSNVSAGPSGIAASCQLTGFDLLGMRLQGRRHPVRIEISRDDMHQKNGDLFYMTSAEATKYFHTIFSDKSRLEYFVTDTVFFTFNSVEYKKVPVRVTANITYKPQYMSVGGLRVSPDSVLVYGNKELIDAVNTVTTDVVRLHSLDTEMYGKVELKPVKGVRLSSQSVDYSINVVRYVQREVQLPVKVLHVPSGVNVKAFPFTATLRYRMKFPADAQMNRVYVAIEYSEFVSSIKGKCVGKVVGMPAEVISYELVPEVFDCIVETDRQSL